MDNMSLLKSSNGYTNVSLDARLLLNRVIYIDDKEISGELTANVVKKIMILRREDSKKLITIIIDSLGGDVKEGMVLYDLLQTCNTPIRIVVAGRAYSMAAVLLAAGRYGRYMLKHSEIMIHQPHLGNAVTGSCSSIRSLSERMNKEEALINQLLAKHTGKTVKQIEKDTGYDHFLDAEEAVSFNLCDGIIGFDEIMEV